MMKKKITLLAGLLAVTLLAAGCGKKNDTPVQEVPVTATPTPEVPKKEGELVDMQQSTGEDEIKNVLGTKTQTAAKLVLVNRTGDAVESVYIRQHPEDEDYDDEEWGEDLVKGRFVLADGDKAVYYYEKSAAKEFDVRVVYKDAERYENYFRKLPLSAITQLTLRMDGKGEEALPFATYLKPGSKREISTLNEVKRRLGLLGDDEDSGEEDSENTENTENPDSENPADGDTQNPGGSDTDTPEPDDNGTGGSTEPGDDNGGDDGSGDNGGGSSPVSTAEGYIGQSVDSLYGALGQPSGSDYQEEPETGKTGYHYYYVDGTAFTVSTTVDENGNEIVAGVW